MEAAGHHNYDLGRPPNNVVPRDTNGIGVLTAELVHTAGEPDHFRHPVTAAVHGLQPLHTENPRAIRQIPCSGRNLVQSSAAVGNHLLGLLHAPRRRAHLAQIVEDLFKRFGRQPQNLRPRRKRF